MQRSMLILGVLAILVCSASPAPADTSTFTETTIASGTVDGTGFTNALVTITLTGDTANVGSGSPGKFSLPGIGMVSVSGVGSDTFTDDIRAAENQALPGAGISDFTLNRTIIFTLNAGFASYDLTSSIGPLSGNGEFNNSFAFPTLGGTFDLTSIGTVTFTAVESVATPEPGSLLLLAAGLAGLLGTAVRKKKVTA